MFTSIPKAVSPTSIPRPVLQARGIDTKSTPAGEITSIQNRCFSVPYNASIPKETGAASVRGTINKSTSAGESYIDTKAGESYTDTKAGASSSATMHRYQSE